MKQFLSFVKKEFYHIFRDRRTILILLVMPVIQIILFGFAITTEVKDTPIAVLNPVKDDASRQIVERLAASEYFTLVSEANRVEDIEKALQKGEIKLAVVFYPDNILHTGEAAVQIIVDATDPNQANIFANYATNIISQWAIENQWNNSQLKIVPQIKMLYNPQMKGAYNFVPGVMGLILMLICAMMTSVSIVREKEMGTMETLLVSPVKPIYIILAKITPYFVLSIVNLTTILLLSVFVLGVPVAGNLWLLILLSLIFILSTLSIGLFISNVVSTQVAAMLISGMALMMPTMLLSGIIYPIESMPEILQWLSCILPVRWYIAAVRALMIQGVDFIFVVKEFAILTGMALVLLGVSLKRFNVRLNN
ncbi:MAG: ABC transporter permease [Dysgonamonadaceae bacterium]|jgi:ABC-2 type transport system permease protein|nr:ABC transporter permease [Dysgonamonadaceae bacterium]